MPAFPPVATPAARPPLPASRLAWWLALGAFLVGVGLRVWQWALGTSFFIDELALVHNVATRSPGALVSQPLADAQVAPPLFLLAEKACLDVLGPSEQALRLPALLGSVLALLLLWRVAARLLDAWLVPPVLLAMGVGFTFVYYGSQAKPYASDAAASLLIFSMAHRLADAARSLPRPLLLGLALAGLVLPFYSYPAGLVLAGSGAVLLGLAGSPAGRPRRWATVAVVGTWAAGCLASLALARHLLAPDTHAYMQAFWQRGMLPPSPELPRVLYTTLVRTLRYNLYWPAPEALWLGAGAVGAGLLWRRQRPAAALLLAPWAVGTLAAAGQLFPLSERLLLYLLPSLVLLVFTGLQEVVRWGWHYARPLGAGLAAGCAVLPLSTSLVWQTLPPYYVEEVQPLLAWLARVRRPTDRVYAYYWAGQSLRWYGPRYGLAPGRYYLGHCFACTADPVGHLQRELATFRGQRVWVIKVSVYRQVDEALTAYLSQLGRPGPSYHVATRLPDGFPSGTHSVQLYDLTGSSLQAGRAPQPAASNQPDCWLCHAPVVFLPDSVSAPSSQVAAARP